jgi:hypothetical protein
VLAVQCSNVDVNAQNNDKVFGKMTDIDGNEQVSGDPSAAMPGA